MTSTATRCRVALARRRDEGRMRTQIFALWIGLGLTSQGSATPLDAAQKAFARGHYAYSAQLLLPEAQRGLAVAQTYLGYLYQQGWGVPRNFGEAGSWFSRAARQGEPAAQFFLGLLYDRGLGVEENPVEAAKW